MQHSFMNFLQAMLRDLRLGRIDDVTGRFSYPSPLFVGSRSSVFASAAHLATALEEGRTALLARGWAGTELRLVAVVPGRDGRLSVLTQCICHDGAGRTLLETGLRFYCDACGETPRIAMVEQVGGMVTGLRERPIARNRRSQPDRAGIEAGGPHAWRISGPAPFDVPEQAGFRAASGESPPRRHHRQSIRYLRAAVR